MKIIKSYNWNRRDFCYDSQCEHCNYIDKNNLGYDDDYYYNIVIPNIKCQICKKSTNSKQTDFPKTIIIPKYNSNDII